MRYNLKFNLWLAKLIFLVVFGHLAIGPFQHRFLLGRKYWNAAEIDIFTTVVRNHRKTCSQDGCQRIQNDTQSVWKLGLSGFKQSG